MTEDEIVGWHQQLKRHDFEQTCETVKDRKAWLAAVHGVAKSQHALANGQQQMESRKMVLKNLFSGQHWGCKPKEQKGKEMVGQIGGVVLKHIHYYM